VGRRGGGGQGRQRRGAGRCGGGQGRRRRGRRGGRGEGGGVGEGGSVGERRRRAIGEQGNEPAREFTAAVNILTLVGLGHWPTGVT
jgi:hypothetical protein